MSSSDISAERGKRVAALSSLWAAIALTATKCVAGLLTGSLGILAEAAHSGLDLVAAFVTFIAVRISGRPADASHLYGHGKVENLSALFETLLLTGTCGWIVQAAIRRLASGSVEVEVSMWSFAVMAASIITDVTRSRVLQRAARQYGSQAFEADALHFQTDVWSSAVVIVGLACVSAARRLPGARWLNQADAVAALGVAAIVIFLSLRLGMRTVHALLDAAPGGLARKIAVAAEGVPGVIACHRVRVRQSGPHIFADINVQVDGGTAIA